MFLLLILALATPLFAAPPNNVTLPNRQSTRVTTSSTTISTITRPTAEQTLPAQPIAETFQLGITRLKAQNFALLEGRRVGLLTHMAAVDENGTLTIDVLKAASNVNLVALFSPEHGLQGLAGADEEVDDSRYAGLPVYSLYGETRKPTKSMLESIDLMVIDLQDIGVRSYTYISAMKLAIQACFEQGIPVIVLDRPNPLGGQKVDGPILDEKFKSYVGSYRIPYIHGLTMGELALVAQSELRPLSGSLTIVKMTGWHRRMLWSDLGLKWRATSPSIPTLGSAFGYACTGLGAQLGGFKHGYGTEYPFRFLSHPKVSPAALKARLDKAGIPGMSFQVLKIPAGQRGAGQEGVYVRINHWQNAGAIQLSLTMLQIAEELQGSDIFNKASKNEVELFNKHWGRGEPLNTLRSGKPLNAWSLGRHWEAEATRWQLAARQFWLYN